MRIRRKPISSNIFCESYLKDKFTYWTLKIILELGGKNEFVDKDNYCKKDELATFLNFKEHFDNDNSTLKDSMNLLEKSYKILKEKDLKSHPILSCNINMLEKILKLSKAEKDVLEFVLLVNNYNILEEATDLLSYSLNTSQAKNLLGKILDIPQSIINKILHPSSKLISSGLVKVDKTNSRSLKNIFESLGDTFVSNMFEKQESTLDLLKEALCRCEESELNLKDYSHLKKDLDILIPYLKKTSKIKAKGINILLYGKPGTGKTELTKVLARVLNHELYEVSYIDSENEPISAKNRISAYRISQNILKNKKAFLIYDEAEDIFDSSDSLFTQKPQKDKAWINKTLESNLVPTFWITNNIYSVDEAIVRRFDMCIHMSIPKKSRRAEIIKKYDNGLLNEESVNILAEHEALSPAIISRATKVIDILDIKDKDESLTHLINSTLKAQGYKEAKKDESLSLPSTYNPNFINSDIDLNLLLEGIDSSKEARICLYGPAGTGKSAYGKYVAKKLEKPFLLKKGSDLISPYVGMTEKNIARAFEEAKDTKAVLVFDEVDSFLQDRTKAKQSWEGTQVNEMLVQMENYKGIFIATTNLIDTLDKASLRRFDLKLMFDYLNSKQANAMFELYAKELQLQKNSHNDIRSLRELTPGDFAAVLRQNRFRPIKTTHDFYGRLEDEVALKNVEDSKKLGFM